MSEKLNVTGLSKSFGPHRVLKDVSMTAHEGDVICLIGSSGSGKSTFLRCLNFLERPDRCGLRLNGVPVELRRAGNGELAVRSQHELRRLRSRLAMVFQQFNLWPHLSVLRNVMLAQRQVLKRSESQARLMAVSCLDRVGLDPSYHDRYPATLSGGQQQRVAIARALAMEPDILLFDEPTSALDPEWVGDVLNTMKRLAQEGTTMILVTHEMGFARDVADRILFLHQGLVEESGPPDRIFGDPRSPRLRQFLSNVG